MVEDAQDRLIYKWSGEPAFADTMLDDGLSSVIPKTVSKEETDFVKTLRAIGAIGHMVLSASESFSKLCAKMGEFVVWNIGNPQSIMRSLMTGPGSGSSMLNGRTPPEEHWFFISLNQDSSDLVDD